MEPALTKDELLNGLNNVLNSFLYGLLCPRLVPAEKWHSVSAGAMLFEGKDDAIKIALGPLSQRLTDPALRERFLRNYENSLLRALLRESHELILLYCEDTNQFSIYRDEPWFQFVRIMRNVVSHKQGGLLTKWPEDLKKKRICSARWRNRTLDTTMIGSAISFYHNEALQLQSDQIEFVKLKLA
jgi:hypothetical protein